MEHPTDPFAVVCRQLSDRHAGSLMLADVVEQVGDGRSCRSVKTKNHFLFLAHVRHRMASSGSGVQVDSSIAHQVSHRCMTPGLRFL
uniref:Uncharacterized protein n=1 Tax=Salinispora arenicola (strain CNS-205) TaxID=391037 RepID=A8LV67_SALAI